MKCAECGKEIKNAYYINGKAYGYNCYKQKLALIYKQWEDERNAEYSAKCFSAMKVFEGKKSNSFHDSICKQWNDCKKLTAKQLECIIKGFTSKEKIDFWCIWCELTNDECLKWSIPSWVMSEIYKNGCVKDYIENEAFINCLLNERSYKKGFYFVYDVEDKQCYIEQIKYLNEAMEDEYSEVLKVISVE